MFESILRGVAKKRVRLAIRSNSSLQWARVLLHQTPFTEPDSPVFHGVYVRWLVFQCEIDGVLQHGDTVWDFSVSVRVFDVSGGRGFHATRASLGVLEKLGPRLGRQNATRRKGSKIPGARREILSLCSLLAAFLRSYFSYGRIVLVGTTPNQTPES